MQRHCTFKPEIKADNKLSEFNYEDIRNKDYTSSKGHIRPQSSKASFERPPIQERLVAEVEKRKEHREKLKREKDLQDMKECSFHPNIKDYKIIPRNPKLDRPFAGMRAQTPIHERIGDL